MRGASEQANGRASGSVLQSVFLVVLDHRFFLLLGLDRNFLLLLFFQPFFRRFTVFPPLFTDEFLPSLQKIEDELVRAFVLLLSVCSVLLSGHMAYASYKISNSKDFL